MSYTTTGQLMVESGNIHVKLTQPMSELRVADLKLFCDQLALDLRIEVAEIT